MLMVEGQPKTEDSIKNWKICLDMRIPIIEDLADYKEEADNSRCCLDMATVY